MNVINAWFDGACEPVNPGGIATYGIYMKAQIQLNDLITNKFFYSSGVIGEGPEMSNNVAEYGAVEALLQFINVKLQHLHIDKKDVKINIYGDSNLVINQLKGNWKVKGGLYVPYYKKTREILDTFPNVTFTWIPRDKNTIADELSKDAYHRFHKSSNLEYIK